jgi:serine phosphatase RsbU (regulator of sigma subunit)
MSREPDPRNDPAWRVLLICLLTTLGAALVHTKAPGWVVAVTWSLALVGTIRFRWFDVRRRKTWLVLLAIMVVVVLLLDVGGVALGVGLLLAFHLRRLGSLYLLSGRRRMVAFLLGLPTLVALILLAKGHPDGVAGQVVMTARTGVEFFWITIVLTLLFGMRLHFLRLRPKLFIAGILVGLVPLILAAVFGVLLFYGTMGGSRANRAGDVMEFWAQSYAAGRTPEALTGESLTWSETDPDQGPAWTAQLLAASREFRASQTDSLDSDEESREFYMRNDEGVRLTIGGEQQEPWLPGVMAAADTAAWLGVGDQYWLTHLMDPGPGQARIDAVRLDSQALDRLAHLLRVELQVRNFQRFDGDLEDELDAASDSTRAASAPLVGRFRPAEGDSTASWWHRDRHFGGAMVPAPNLSDGKLEEGYLFLSLRTSFADLAREFVSEENWFNILILVGLGAVIVLFLFMQVVALIFSLRITGGITDAVRALHQGTRRIAEGDLDTRIEIPNEDEFGDLAQGFNEMAAAVKQGREDALARERLMQEMETARQIQARLLPHAEPLLPGWQITGLSIPSRQVGGDYFDFLQPGPGKLGVAIGDVSGKGMPAALLMSNLQACLKGQILHPAPVSDVVTRVNDLLSESTDPHMFATFFYGEIDGPSGHFVSTNAGHNPPLLVRRDGQVEWLEAGGLILGMFAGQPYEQVEVDLAPGDVLVLYTDGITEAGAPEIGDDEAAALDDVDDDEVMFGEDRLEAVVVRARERSAMGIREAILSAVQEFVADGPQGDDITLVVVKHMED